MLREARPEPATHDKLTHRIRVSAPFMVTEKLHRNITMISQLTGNAPMANALRMSALIGSNIIIQKLGNVTVTNLYEATTGIDERLQDKMRKVICDFTDQITACAQANDCDEFEALAIILTIGSAHGKVNDWSAPEEAKEAKRRA